jgi:hypothetical protein
MPKKHITQVITFQLKRKPLSAALEPPNRGHAGRGGVFSRRVKGGFHFCLTMLRQELSEHIDNDYLSANGSLNPVETLVRENNGCGWNDAANVLE